MIPESAVEAAHRAICEDDLDDCLEWRGRCVRAVEASAPHILAPALSLADEMDNVHGSIRGHVTTCQLRKALGVSDE